MVHRRAMVYDLIKCIFNVVVGGRFIRRRRREEVVDVDEMICRTAEQNVGECGVEFKFCDIVVVRFGVADFGGAGADIPVQMSVLCCEDISHVGWCIPDEDVATRVRELGMLGAGCN